jgi:hypothetical protein
MSIDPKLQRDNPLPTEHAHLGAGGHADAANAVMQVVQLATGFWFSRCLQAVAEIGVADVLSDEPQAAADLARTVGANTDSLNRVLRLLSSQGVFAFVDGRYSHTPLSRALRADDPHSLRSYVRFVGTPLFWDSYAEMEHVIRTGNTGVTKIDPRGVFAYMNDHPHVMELFNGAMRGKAESAIGPVLAAYDFSAFQSVADIGGGLGHLLKAILQTAPILGGCCSISHMSSPKSHPTTVWSFGAAISSAMPCLSAIATFSWKSSMIGRTSNAPTSCDRSALPRPRVQSCWLSKPCCRPTIVRTSRITLTST